MTNSANLTLIGKIRTRYKTLKSCPRNTRLATGTATLEIDPAYRDGMLGLEDASHILVLYWLDRVERNILRHITPHDGIRRGVFATRAPIRPNPIGIAAVKVLSIGEGTIETSPLDCLDGTGLIDIKPYIKSNDCHTDARLAWLEK